MLTTAEFKAGVLEFIPEDCETRDSDIQEAIAYFESSGRIYLEEFKYVSGCIDDNLRFKRLPTHQSDFDPLTNQNKLDILATIRS